MPVTAERHDTEQFAPTKERIDKLEHIRALLDEITSGARDGANAEADAGPVTAPVTGRTRRQTRGRETKTMTASAAQTAQSNVPTFDYYLGKAEEYGELAGKGKNAAHAYLVELLAGGYLGGLTFEPREGQQEGDHAALSARYAAKQGLVNRTDPKAGNMKKLKSDFGLAIKTGQNPKFGTGEPLGVTNAYIAQLDKLRKSQIKGLRDTYNGLLNLWRTINKTGVVPSAKDLDAFCFVKESAPITVDRALAQARKLLQRVSQGKLPNCNDMDDSKDVKDAIACINKRLNARSKVQGKPATVSAGAAALAPV